MTTNITLDKNNLKCPKIPFLEEVIPNWQQIQYITSAVMSQHHINGRVIGESSDTVFHINIITKIYKYKYIDTKFVLQIHKYKYTNTNIHIQITLMVVLLGRHPTRLFILPSPPPLWSNINILMGKVTSFGSFARLGYFTTLDVTYQCEKSLF